LIFFNSGALPNILHYITCPRSTYKCNCQCCYQGPGAQRQGPKLQEQGLEIIGQGVKIHVQGLVN